MKRRTLKRRNRKRRSRKIKWRAYGGSTTEANCKYVSSRGILKSCDVHSANPVSSTKTIDIDLKSIKDGSTVYVPGSAIPDFINKMGAISSKFILVSGDCDESISPSEIIDSGKIIHWFSQNCVTPHPKMTAIPIGLDYHTLSTTSMRWGKQATPLEQEAQLEGIRKTTKPFHERAVLCYSNFHNGIATGSVSKFKSDREAAIEQVPKELVFAETDYITREDTWKHQVGYAFVLSPHGNGLDCHRTWEALVLGCIPIVKTSPIDSLYDDLPVLIVKEWSDVTLDLLTRTIQAYKDKTFNYDKLLLKYWVDIINSKKSAI